MRLARMGPSESEIPVVAAVGGDTWHDLRPVTPDIDARFLPLGLGLARTALADESLPMVGPGRFGPPVSDTGKVVSVGMNYRAHAAEVGAQIPEEPIVFMKGSDTVVGANDRVLVPRGSTRTDYEAELAVVIGREARYSEAPSEARGCIAGYAASNDVSEREFQLERGGQWDKGKNCETFNPLGPWLLTADEVEDPQALSVRLWVNGELRQSSNTEDMIFEVNDLVWYLSQFMVLRPGDVINTGTPAGVALGRAGGSFLKAGDIVELEIEGLGRQRQQFGQA